MFNPARMDYMGGSENNKSPKDEFQRRTELLAQVFMKEEMSGARWDVPGWADFNEELDRTGIGAIPDWLPHQR
jgi:hypothetical protein